MHPIEAESYRRLRALVDTSDLPPLSRAVVERVVHASGDLGYVDDLVLDEADLRTAVDALAADAPVVVDVAMVATGITSRDTVCRLADPRVADLAQRTGATRSAAAIRLAADEVGPGAVYVVGCAPTALRALCGLPSAAPTLVIGMPVGFVDAVESKAALRASGLPAVTNRGRTGGSAVAAAACNALLYAIGGP